VHILSEAKLWLPSCRPLPAFGQVPAVMSQLPNPITLEASREAERDPEYRESDEFCTPDTGSRPAQAPLE